MLGAYELLVGKSFPGDLMPKAAHILKEFYDKDLLEEEVILQWSEKVILKYKFRFMANIWGKIKFYRTFLSLVCLIAPLKATRQTAFYFRQWSCHYQTKQ